MKKNRALTADEIELAKGIFGSSIDYAKVRVHDGKFMPFHPPHTGMAPNGNLYMNGCYMDDYAKGDPLMRSLFIHEMTHVWQFQNKILEPIATAMELSLKFKFNYGASYNYALDGQKDLTDYNMEQQATLVQDYFLLRHEKTDEDSGRCQDNLGADAKLAELEKILARFLQNPSYAKRDSFPPLSGKFKPPKIS